jgi:uncharacterized protein (TIGR03118 family)
MKRLRVHSIFFAISVGLSAALFCSAAFAQYQVTNLVSNTGDARYLDHQLVNPWGMAFSPGGGGYQGGPFWINDEASGWATSETAFSGPGVPRLIVPAGKGNGTGSPTGVVLNLTQDFHVRGFYSIYLLVTLDGTIDAWVPQINYYGVQVVINNSNAGDSYTGLAISQHLQPTPNYLFAADYAHNQVDIYDGNFNFVKSFTDTGLRGMAPFGVKDINGQVYVTFVSTSGIGLGGVVDVFNEDGTFVKRLISGPHLNHPWGMAVAPSNFGLFSNALLISNNTGTGTINGFNLSTGAFIGTVKNSSGAPIVIDGLWGIEFGGGSPKDGSTNQLFFTAGPNHGADGLFGVIAYQ